MFIAKGITLTVIVFLLTLALFRVDGLVQERIEYRDQAVAEVNNSLSGPQTLLGPVIAIGYTEEWIQNRMNEKGDILGQEARTERRQLWVLPERLDIVGKINPDFRKRGLFRVAGYDSSMTLKGHFILPTEMPAPIHGKASKMALEDFGTAMIGLRDSRGIRRLDLRLNGQLLDLETGTGIAGQAGAQGKVRKIALNGAKLDFEVELELTGAESLAIVPLGKDTQTTLSSPWAHPSFFGSFLPSQREVSQDGFTATWKVSSLANEARDQWLRAVAVLPAEGQAGKAIPEFKSYGVRILEPVNSYSLTDRAIKYGLLFIASTLTVFALFELLKQLQVHPLQYLMIGMALVLFFVLLLSLSERIGFERAYACAALACIALITYYSRFVLHGWRPAAMIGAQLSLSFGGLFGLLHSEQNALLTGSLALFAALAAIMIGTRHVNWFEKFTPGTLVRPTQAKQG